jgi:threonylcarbamoyladenosine tRNA methylthiotransferase MtaB
MSSGEVVLNMGCRLNAYESSVINSILKSLSMQNDFVVINTCTITNESEKQCRQEIRKLKKDYPNKKILVTGCASQLHQNFFIAMPEVEFVIANDIKNNKSAYNEIAKFHKGLSSFSKEDLQNYLITEKAAEDFYEVYDFNQKSRAFLAIQSGCNHYCSFCIVPFTRGKMKSAPIEEVIKFTKAFIENGYNEVVLTGVDITDYGTDLYQKRSLGVLCKRILAETNLKRLRLSSVDVAELDKDLIEVFKDARFMPYFHISLQSGSNSILKKMRRRHTRENLFEFRDLTLSIKSNTLFGADIITGFVNETEDEFLDSVSVAEQIPITFMHAFSYSKKEQTLASRMPDDLSLQEKKRRTNILINIGKENLKNENLKMIGSEFVCILENGGFAKTENFMTIKLLKENPNFKPKDIVQVKVLKLENDELLGEIVQ